MQREGTHDHFDCGVGFLTCVRQRTGPFEACFSGPSSWGLDASKRFLNFILVLVMRRLLNLAASLD
jgi:hypothetical protein